MSAIPKPSSRVKAIGKHGYRLPVIQLITEFGVWHPEDGIIYSACYVEACHDHINDALADEELTEYMKGCRIVEMKYISPKDRT